MKKPTIKRLGLGLLQHLAAMFILVSIAGILFNSYLTVESMNGMQTYYLSPMDTEPEFEDSEVFREIFRTAVSDITRLVVIKGQVETDGVFDADKNIDVTQYADRTGKGNGCPVTAVYELEDLIKWGKYGLEYVNRPMSMSEFVNYFGPAASPDNFAIDENGQLYFAGFLDKAFVPKINHNLNNVISIQAQENDQDLSDSKELVLAEMKKYTEEQLEDMAFSYIMSNSLDEVSLSREDDGTYTVYFSMLSCRYDTVDRERQLVNYASNWIDYTMLQNNVAEAVTSLSAGYEQYQNCNHLYLENVSNLKYVVRMMAEDGSTRTFTNVSEMEDQPDNIITDNFSEFRRYLIYYPDSLEFTSNTNTSEEEIRGFLTEFEYAYPDTTHIWIGVDTAYPIEGDAFYSANMVFQRIVPNVGYIVVIGVILGVLWLVLGFYLSYTAGVAYDENRNKVLYLNGFDRIWTEFLVVFGLVLLFAGIIGYYHLLDVADGVYVSHSELFGERATTLYEYGSFAAYGFLSSVLLNLVWYSFVRRLKSANLWRDSFVHWMLRQVRKGVDFVLSHKNTAVSILIPYNLFVLTNLVGVLSAYIFRERGAAGILILGGLVVLDGYVGITVFRQRAEQIDIVEGIRRIRNGEVEYKLNADALHGDNKEMADAVNNIGEGIRNAVKTSMKDEQMKTDLITNVSHDIKTPLTSIINYVDLLKRLKIQEEPAKSYIDILDNKSQRLKQLTDDLVEASKISSGNIELNFEKINLTELVQQSVGEFSEKMEDKNLQVLISGGEHARFIYADSRRMWRIIENLFNNICKYAMDGTRVYLDLDSCDEIVTMSVKNISARQMNIRPDELTERFIRGDSARSTEGSGLGLYIAKSLTGVQGGEFEIHLDGDLFKVTIRFPEYIQDK